MSTLKSRLFIVTDTATNAKLEACATGIPNEHSTHFTLNSSGEHIRLVQVALSRVKNREPGLKIPDFKIDGNYSSDFARAVFRFKEAKGIKNFAGKIDDIVGRKTIISLDREEGPAEILPVPQIPPDDFTKPIPVKTITRKVFSSTSIPKSEKPDDGSSSGLSTRDLVDALKDIFDSFQDPDFFLGKEDLGKRKIEFINEDFGVNIVTKNTTVDISTFSGAVTNSITTTIFTYQYGNKTPFVTVNSTFQSKLNGTSQQVQSSKELIPRATAEKSQVIVPSRPR
jgi:hypothetical protein